MQVDYVIQNKVSEKDFEQIVYDWLIKGDYTPDDITENIITENNILLMPIHFYKNDYHGSSSATLGYPRTEYFYTWDNVNKKQIQRSRTVTDWYPHSQAVHGNITTVVYAGSLASEPIVTFVEKMGWNAEDLYQLPSTNEHYGKLSSLFKYSKVDVWRITGFDRTRQRVYEQAKKELPSTLVQNLSVIVNFTETISLSLIAPYWIFNYQYKDEQHYVIVDGNAPTRIDGSRPVDKKRMANVSAIRWYGWIAVITIVVSILYLLAGEDFSKLEFSWLNAGIVAGGIATALIITEARVSNLKRKSLETRKVLLTQMLKRLN